MKRSFGEKVFNVCNITIMLIICVVTLYPFLNQLAIAFNDGMDSMSGGLMIIPRVFTLDNFKAVFKNSDFYNSVILSVTITIIHTATALLVTYMAAYGLTRKGVPYKRGITLFLMIPAYIHAGMIPAYINMKNLHLINNYMVYILPVLFTFYNMVIIRSFLQELPPSIEESARVDGAGEFRIMFQIIMPLSVPVIATVCLWLAVAAWNNWTTTLYYVTDKNLFTVQYFMMKLIKEAEAVLQMAQQLSMDTSSADRITEVTSDSIKSAALIVTTIPIVCVYPFLQKYFIKGVTLGGVKE